LRNRAGLRPALFHFRLLLRLALCSSSSLPRSNPRGSLPYLLTELYSYRRTSTQSVTLCIDDFARQACLDHQTTQSRFGRRKMSLKTREGRNRQTNIRKPENERSRLQRGKRLLLPSCLLHQLRRLCFANSIVANGSEDLILVQNGSKVVLVLTDTDQYETLRLTDHGKGLPANYRTFVSRKISRRVGHSYCS